MPYVYIGDSTSRLSAVRRFMFSMCMAIDNYGLCLFIESMRFFYYYIIFYFMLVQHDQRIKPVSCTRVMANRRATDGYILQLSYCHRTYPTGRLYDIVICYENNNTICYIDFRFFVLQWFRLISSCFRVIIVPYNGQENHFVSNCPRITVAPTEFIPPPYLYLSGRVVCSFKLYFCLY